MRVSCENTRKRRFSGIFIERDCNTIETQDSPYAPLVQIYFRTDVENNV